jgi:hypothetical protein
MHFQFVVGAVREEIRATGTEVGQRGDELLGRGFGGRLEMERCDVGLPLVEILSRAQGAPWGSSRADGRCAVNDPSRIVQALRPPLPSS